MILMMFEITTQGIFYGMGKIVPPAAVSITCNTLRIPLAIILVSTSLGIDGVWWAISISSMMKGAILFSWFLFISKKAKM
jgi:Na+-driven multidrug efflux pump